MSIKIGLIGKTNTGKTTFFNSSTLSTDEISTYPFTTKKSSTSVGHAITLCVHKELNVQDNPINSIGIYLQPSLHLELFGLSFTLNSL